MKQLNRIIIFTLSLFLISQFAFAKTVSFNDENYSGTVTFNDNVEIGDAVFVRLNIKYLKKAEKKSVPDTQAVLKLMQKDKQIGVSRFFPINDKKDRNKNIEMLCGIPLSTWLDASETYTLKVIFDTKYTTGKEIEIPVNFVDRHFISETIELNESNTNIKNNMSPERLAQIEKLNKILGTTISSDVYTLNRFIKPVQSERMTSFFGDRRTFKYINNETSTSMHYGNDYGVPEGTKISACGTGKVVMAENRISTGWSVVIEHQPGLYSLYYHMSKLNVKEGQSVKAGELIGLSGSTGLATGPHLHWEIRLNMSAVRPEFFLNDFSFNEGELN